MMKNTHKWNSDAIQFRIDFEMNRKYTARRLKKNESENIFNFLYTIYC